MLRLLNVNNKEEICKLRLPCIRNARHVHHVTLAILLVFNITHPIQQMEDLLVKLTSQIMPGSRMRSSRMPNTGMKSGMRSNGLSA